MLQIDPLKMEMNELIAWCVKRDEKVAMDLDFGDRVSGNCKKNFVVAEWTEIQSIELLKGG